MNGRKEGIGEKGRKEGTLTLELRIAGVPAMEAVTNLTSVREVRVPSLFPTQWVKDPALP